MPDWELHALPMHWEVRLAAESGMDVVNEALLEILRCPVCKGRLDRGRDSLACAHCTKTYPVVHGIPDLRVYEDPLIPLALDFSKGEKIQAQAERLSFADLVRFYWSLPTHPYTPPDLKERFIRHVLTDEERIRSYRDEIGSGGTFLEVGCGTAAVVSAVARDFRLAIGCDVAFRWLLVARKRLIEARVPVNLVCCCADYLPFLDGFFDSVASVALLEHLPDADAVIGEFGRVTKPRGRLFTWTTNRFSVAAEPHVGVWGVGFLPRTWMPAYVRWRSGLAYNKKRLLSRFELGRFLRQAGFSSIRFIIPRVTDADSAHLSAIQQRGAAFFRTVASAGLGWPATALYPVLAASAVREKEATTEQDRSMRVSV
jgi:ubiquinone/menaquinone biosynthesis C-methylase UbiE/uncharacterized protein YbaR (Trm112 family)